MLIYKIALLYIRDGTILSFRSRGKDVYYNFGGKREGTETVLQILACEIKEEMYVAILENAIKLKHRHMVIRKESLCG